MVCRLRKFNPQFRSYTTYYTTKYIGNTVYQKCPHSGHQTILDRTGLQPCNYLPSPVTGSQVDRFIPYRGSSNFEAACPNISHLEVELISNITDHHGDSKQIFLNTAKYANNIINYRKRLSHAMDLTKSKVLQCSFPSKRPQLNEKGPLNPFWPVIPRKEPLISPPNALLDMPDIDTTMNHHVIDWGKQGQIATIFSGEVHLWESSKSEVALTKTDGTILDCVKWNRQGTKLAVSRSLSRLSIIDAKTLKIERTVTCKCLGCTFTSIEWSSNGTVIAGCCYGCLVSVINNQPPTFHYYRHLSNNIIDLKLSCEDSYLLASTMGGINAIFKWPLSLTNRLPAMVFSAKDDDRCYIKSTSWHPWKEPLLAVGEIDNTITVWNVNNQKIVDSSYVKPYFTDASVLDCLTFNPVSAELLVSFYYTNPDPKNDEAYNFLTVFSDLHTRVDEMKFHIGRVPYALWDGTGTKLATVGADENLVIWDFFGSNTDTEKKMLSQKKKKPSSNILAILEAATSMVYV